MAREQGRGEADIRFPRWGHWALFGVISVVLFRSFIFSDQMLFGTDTMALGYQARRFFADALSNGGGFPLWNPTILGGMPFIEALAGGDSLYPTSLLLLFMETHRALGWKLILHVFVAGIGGFAWLRSLGLSKGAALVGGTGFLLAPWMVSLVFPAQDGKLFVTALTPFLFLNVRALLLGPRMKNVAGTAVVVAIVLFSTHFQAAYFLFGAAGVYAICLCLAMAMGVEFGPGASSPRARGGSGGAPPVTSGGPRFPRANVAVRRFGIFLAASIWGAAISAVQLIPAVDYVNEFSRRTATTVDAEPAVGIAYSSSWGLHPEEIVGLAVPEFVGGSLDFSRLPVPEWAGQTYWGQNGIKLNHEYLGIVVLILGLLAFAGPRLRIERRILLAIGGVALLFALGTHTPVWRIFYEVFPGIPLFRAPSIAIFVAGFSALTLAAIGAENLIRAGEASEGDRRRLIHLSAGAAVGLLLFTVLVASGVFLDLWLAVFRSDDPQAAGQVIAAEPFITRGFIVALFFGTALFGIVWSAVHSKIGPVAVTAALVGLVGIDHYRVDAAYLQVTPAISIAEPDPNAQFLMDVARTDPPFRVLDLEGNGQGVTLAAFGIELAAGHHPNDLLFYRELIGMEGGGEPSNLFGSDAVRQILNVRYMAWPNRERGENPAGVPVVSATELGGALYQSILEIPTLPRARLVGRATVLPEDQVLPYILSGAFQPAEEVVFGAQPDFAVSGEPAIGTVRWVERNVNDQILDVQTDQPAFLVLAETWFPAWKARVDGEEVEVLRANHALRAVPVPAGSHTVELSYESTILRSSLGLSLVSLAALLGWMGLDLLRARRAEPVTEGE